MEKRPGAVTFQDEPLTLVGSPITVGAEAGDICLCANDMAPVCLSDFAGKVTLVLTVPSLDTPVCDLEARRFNSEAMGLGPDVAVLVVSMDLPFAQARWCGAAGADQVRTLSDYKDTALGLAWGLLIEELRLLARAVVVLDRQQTVQYVQLVKEVTQTPDYEAALEAVRKVRSMS